MHNEALPAETKRRNRRLVPWVSPTLFAAIVLAFALPFATVSCNGGTVHTTGLQLATWTVPAAQPPAKTDDGVPLAKAVEQRESIWALLTLACAVAGLACALRRRHEGKAALAGLIAVLIMWFASYDPLGPDVRYDAGFVVVTLGFLTLAVWQLAVAIRRRRRRRRSERAAFEAERAAYEAAPY